MRPDIEIVAAHYQETYATTVKAWEQRNRIFLILMITVGAAALLTFEVPQAQPLLADLIAKAFSVEGIMRQTELRASLPYGLIQSILVMAVLYLMLLLYHRTAFIVRNYSYLEALEKELRSGLDLAPESAVFTRESDFYWSHRPVLSKGVAVVYALMLGSLLAAFLGMRIYGDLCSGHPGFVIVDGVLSLLIAVFFVAYVLSSKPKPGRSTKVP